MQLHKCIALAIAINVNTDAVLQTYTSNNIKKVAKSDKRRDRKGLDFSRTLFSLITNIYTDTLLRVYANDNG